MKHHKEFKSIDEIKNYDFKDNDNIYRYKNMSFRKSYKYDFSLRFDGSFDLIQNITKQRLLNILKSDWTVVE